jgi:hypothetical protein
MDREPIGQRLGDAFLGSRAFVERDKRQAAVVVQRAGETGGEAGLGALCHGQHQDAGAVQQAGCARDGAGAQGRGQVDAAEQRVVADIGMQP